MLTSRSENSSSTDLFSLPMMRSTSVVGTISAWSRGSFGSEHDEFDDPVSCEYPTNLVSVRSSLSSSEDSPSLVFGGNAELVMVLLA